MERRLLKDRQPGLESGEDFRRVQTETNRRLREGAVGVAAKKPIVAAVQNPNPQPPPTLTPGIPDRSHKWWPYVVKVGNNHYVGEDPVVNPEYAPPSNISTLTDAYAMAKIEQAKNSYGRCAVFVYGGYWTEDLTLDDPNIDFIGIGQPILTGRVTIAAACTQILFENFYFYRRISEGVFASSNISLTIESAAESTTPRSAIQIKNVWFDHNCMAVKCSRRTDFTDCTTVFAQDSFITPNYPLWMLQNGNMTEPSEHIWRLERCKFYAYQSPSYYFEMTCALSITVVNDLGTMWTPMGTSGVILTDCEVYGYTSNYGWRMQHFNYHGENGYFVNATSGSVHHLLFCETDQNIDAYTYFDGGWVGCRYLVNCADFGAATGKTCNVWIRNFVHGGNWDAVPIAQGGTSVHNILYPGHTIPAANVNTWVAQSTSGALTGFWAPGAVDLATTDGTPSVFNVAQTIVDNPMPSY